MAAIKLVSGFCNQLWSSKIDLVPFVVRRPASTTEPSAQLQVGHVKLAVYQGIPAMYSPRPGLGEISIDFMLREQKVGTM